MARVLVEGDTEPFINAALTRGGSAVDLTGKTVTAHVHRTGLATLVKPTTIVGNPTLGIVRVDWDPGDIAIGGDAKVGQLILELVIDGEETTPHPKHFRVRGMLT